MKNWESDLAIAKQGEQIDAPNAGYQTSDMHVSNR